MLTACETVKMAAQVADGVAKLSVDEAKATNGASNGVNGKKDIATAGDSDDDDEDKADAAPGEGEGDGGALTIIYT